MKVLWATGQQVKEESTPITVREVGEVSYGLYYKDRILGNSVVAVSQFNRVDLPYSLAIDGDFQAYNS